MADHNLPIIFKCNGRSYEKSEEIVTTYIDYSEPKKNFMGSAITFCTVGRYHSLFLKLSKINTKDGANIIMFFVNSR